MAKRSGIPRHFRNDPQLNQYKLEKVVPTGKTLGVGSYGSVVEVKYKQVSCAAKRMHELLLDPGNEGVQETIQKYRWECQLMAGLRHPNITQFLGVCFLEGSELPLLVMEKLEMSVDDLLECAPNIPLPVKITILTDTCSGLVYLHGMPSPIVHRDLTARNVLLTSSLSAKITDLGNSRIANLRPAQLAQTMSKLPGTLVYMPPEALNESHRYGPSLDVFSFGHLALYTLTQIFPGDLLSATYVDPERPGEVIGRSEVKRREVYMKKLENQLADSHPILVELVTHCLHNNPQTRPSAEQLLTRLQPVNSTLEKLYGGNLINVAYVRHIKETNQKDKSIAELEALKIGLETENVESHATIVQLQNEKYTFEAIIARITAEKHEVEANSTRLQVEIDQLQSEIQQLHSAMNQLNAEKLQLDAEKLQQESHHQQEKLALQLEVERLSNELQRTSTLSPATFSLQPDWRRGPDMPVAMSRYIQSIEIKGTVYVGAGATDRFEQHYIVMAYNTDSSQWHTLPPYHAKQFAMTTIKNKLVLVGGQDRYNSVSNVLGEWQPDSNQWTHPFPPMPTQRYWPSATSYNNWLVVAGGTKIHRVQVVEVLDISTKQWSSAPSTPVAWIQMKSIVIGDTWYLMGGESRMAPNNNVYSASLEALVSSSAPDSPKLWKKLPSLDCTFSSPLNIRGSLLAVGGIDTDEKPVSTIQRYDPQTTTWVPAGQLPYSVWNCTCLMLSDQIHMMGGYNERRVKEMFTSLVL